MRIEHLLSGTAIRFRIVFFMLVLPLPHLARADLILSLSPSSLTATPGATVTFQGRITNTTGVTLNATDMFLNFIGFDPAALTDTNQLLGTPDFALPNNHTSGIVNLFSVLALPTALPGSYTLGVTLQDINNNSSNAVTATVQIGASAVPEPSAIVPTASAISLMLLAQARRRRRIKPARARLSNG